MDDIKVVLMELVTAERRCHDTLKELQEHETN
jgi:hypothetical protein